MSDGCVSVQGTRVDRVTLDHDVQDGYADDPPIHQTIGTARFAPCDVIAYEEG
ncbi:hypothetical protein [Paraburkholderia monticola]|uniref:hypothetical protein n=1 Tax=Paraburkholderia monticola TaxID=1399968 RepID=UPI000A6B83AD|nr:hypothetical protein [Paraburkholderia monticola]